MTQIVIIIAVLAFAVWWLIAVGVRIGASTAVKKIVDGFLGHPDLTCSPEQLSEIQETLGQALSKRSEVTGRWEKLGWALSGVDDYWDKQIGLALARVGSEVGYAEGAEVQCRLDAPKSEEVKVIMNRDDLQSLAWLADYGLRIWTMPGDKYVRSGERLPRDRAEKLTGALDTFERRVAKWSTETEDEEAMRFFSSEDRMKRIWEDYEGPDW